MIDATAERPVYAMICYDDVGKERAESGGLLSETVIGTVRDTPVTDVFLFSHGWNHDVEGAVGQYDSWLRTALAQGAGIEAVRRQRQDFKPLLIGLHWPSLSWGDEDLPGTSFTADAGGGTRTALDLVRERIADTPAAVAAFQALVAAAERDPSPDRLPQDAVAAYRVLYREARLADGGAGAAPGADHDTFDPQDIHDEWRGAEEELAGQGALPFGGSVIGGLLSPLRVLSFWTMKTRARTVGEAGPAALLRALRAAVPAGRTARVHAMGHSFGCIVISAMASGPTGSPPDEGLLDTVFLVQGALSLWSYCNDIPEAPGTAGYFRRMIEERRVSGPIVAVHSEHDTACGTFYPIGSRLSGSVAFDGLPKYGALGSFGVQGPGNDPVAMTMKPVGDPYGFTDGKLYNIDGSPYIRARSGLAGAHSDIAHPEVAHAFWSAVART